MSCNDLKRLNPVNELNAHQWDVLNNGSQIKTLPAGTVLYKGDYRNWFVYLLDGDVSIVNVHGHQHFLLSDNDRFKLPLFGGDLGFDEVTANSDVEVILYDRNTYDLLRRNSELESEKLESISVDAVESEIFEKIFTAYSVGEIELPSLPDIAMKVHKAVENEHVTIEDIAHIIEADPALAAHILKLANSPLQRTFNPVLSIGDAIMRLGMSRTRDYVLVFSIQNVFKTSSPQLKTIMKKLYVHSAQVAAMCMSIAKFQNMLKPESALLAGLLHDIGVIPILTYAAKISSESDMEKEIGDVVTKLKPLVGSMMLKQWGLDNLFVCVVENAENWFRDESEDLDYGDLVVIAQLQKYIRPQIDGDIPELESVPAFKKMKEISDDPECGDKIIKIAHEELKEVMSLLSV